MLSDFKTGSTIRPGDSLLQNYCKALDGLIFISRKSYFTLHKTSDTYFSKDIKQIFCKIKR